MTSPAAPRRRLVRGSSPDIFTPAAYSPAEIMTEARGWLADCFEDCPDDLTDTEVVEAVERHAHGGWAGFLDLF